MTGRRVGPTMEEQQIRPGPVALLGILSLLVLGYSLLVIQSPLVGLVVVALLWGVYLVWQVARTLGRFVDALERIARALEEGAEPGDASEEPQSRDST